MDLLPQHTIDRFSGKKLQLMCIYGFDGSTGGAQYNLQYDNDIRPVADQLK